MIDRFEVEAGEAGYSHSFTFYPAETQLENLDILQELKGTIDDLYNKILKDYREDADFPDEFLVEGDFSTTEITPINYDETTFHAEED